MHHLTKVDDAIMDHLHMEGGTTIMFNNNYMEKYQDHFQEEGVTTMPIFKEARGIIRETYKEEGGINMKTYKEEGVINQETYKVVRGIHLASCVVIGDTNMVFPNEIEITWMVHLLE